MNKLTQKRVQRKSRTVLKKGKLFILKFVVLYRPFGTPPLRFSCPSTKFLQTHTATFKGKNKTKPTAQLI